MANAVRDNPQRAQFVGYDPQWVRFMMVALSGFFAGIAGGLAALNYEIVSAESLSAYTSGLVLLATYLGGIRLFGGPIAGAIAVTLMQTVLASYTKAWPFYFGMVFLATVLFVPGGIAGIAMLQKRLWDAGLLKRALPIYAAMAIPVIATFTTAIGMVEMVYRGNKAPETWAGAVVGLVIGVAITRQVWKRFEGRWTELTEKVPG